MKGEGGTATKSDAREDSRKIINGGKFQEQFQEKTSIPTPQLTIDQEKRRDFFNKLLDKYSSKSAKACTHQQGLQRTRMAAVSPPKAPVKIKDKIIKKKKSNSEKISNSMATPEIDDSDQEWKLSVKSHVIEPMVPKNYQRIRARFPIPLPVLKEEEEPEESELSESEATQSEKGNNCYKNDTNRLPETIEHSFTLLPSGDQKFAEIKYEEKKLIGPNPLPDELKPRQLTKTPSGSLIWVGNNIINGLTKKKGKKASVEESGDKVLFGKGGEEKAAEGKCSGEGEEQSVKTSTAIFSKIRKPKMKKNISSAPATEESLRVKQAEAKFNSKTPSSSSMQDETKAHKKQGEKLKKPKKFAKKQPFTIATSSKPSA